MCVVGFCLYWSSVASRTLKLYLKRMYWKRQQLFELNHLQSIIYTVALGKEFIQHCVFLFNFHIQFSAYIMQNYN